MYTYKFEEMHPCIKEGVWETQMDQANVVIFQGFSHSKFMHVISVDFTRKSKELSISNLVTIK